MSDWLSFDQARHLLVCLSVCLSVYLSIYLSIDQAHRLSISLALDCCCSLLPQVDRGSRSERYNSKRIPAYTDRILVRSVYYDSPDHCPHCNEYSSYPGEGGWKMMVVLMMKMVVLSGKVLLMMVLSMMAFDGAASANSDTNGNDAPHLHLHLHLHLHPHRGLALLSIHALFFFFSLFPFPFPPLLPLYATAIDTSDHKPVYASFLVNVRRLGQSVPRSERGNDEYDDGNGTMTMSPTLSFLSGPSLPADVVYSSDSDLEEGMVEGFMEGNRRRREAMSGDSTRAYTHTHTHSLSPSHSYPSL